MARVQSSEPPPAPEAGRRRLLALFVNGIAAVFGGGLAALLSVFAAKPAAAPAGERWIRAGSTTDLMPGVPVPRVISVAAADGWYRGRSRTAVFLVWDGDRAVRALSATCTHLGCQVQWDEASDRFRCPCHGGVFDARGAVLEGPPPRRLDELAARVDRETGTILVRL